MAKADLEMALVKAQGRSPLTSEEMLELLGIDIGTLITEHDMDLYQAEEVMMWRKHEALRWTAQLTSFPEPIQESKKLSIGALNKMILGGKKVIKESTGAGGLGIQAGGDSGPRMIVVDWDDDGAGIDPLVELHPDAVHDWNLIAATEGEDEANYAVAEMLSDEMGWLVNGWEWQ